MKTLARRLLKIVKEKGAYVLVVELCQCDGETGALHSYGADDGESERDVGKSSEIGKLLEVITNPLSHSWVLNVLLNVLILLVFVKTKNFDSSLVHVVI